MFGYFYHNTIRKYVVAFGTLFNNVQIERPTENGGKQRIRVPLSYAAKEKYIRRLQEGLEILITEDNQQGLWTGFLPRMSFEITDIQYDPLRKRNTLSKNRVYEPTSDKLAYNYAEVPYNFDFTLNILTRKMDDGLQIVEQIIPYFAPEFTLSLDLADFAQKIDVPIVMNGFQQNIEFEGEGSDVDIRVVSWQLDFTMRGYIYGPTKNASVIKSAIAQFFDKDNDYRIEALRVNATGGTGSIGTGTGATLNPETYGTEVIIFGPTASNGDIFDS